MCVCVCGGDDVCVWGDDVCVPKYRTASVGYWQMTLELTQEVEVYV